MKSRGRWSAVGIVAIALLAIALFPLGCMPTRYLAQAAGGQLEILRKRRPIDEVLVDDHVPPHVRALLGEVPAIKAFGERYGLKPTSNYRTYVDLRRSAVVWVVGACDPWSFTPKTWSFPIVGAVPYLGWFSREDAERHAAELRAEGFDVDVRPASAFSTLGWFEDPILSTMIDKGPSALGELANVVLHESTHATHYVDGQTAFDEGIARFVGDRLAPIWLREARGPNSWELRAYLERERRRITRGVAFERAYADLKLLYASGLPRSTIAVEKALRLARLRAEIGSQRPINNATLYEYRSYNGATRVLDRLLAACGDDLVRFIRVIQRIDGDSFSRKQERDLGPVVDPWIRTGCPD